MRPVVRVGEAGKSESTECSVHPKVACRGVVTHGGQGGPEARTLRRFELPLAERTPLAVRIAEDGYPGVGLLAHPTVRFLDLPTACLIGRETEDLMRHGMRTERHAEFRGAAHLVPADRREFPWRARRVLQLQPPGKPLDRSFPL